MIVMFIMKGGFGEIIRRMFIGANEQRSIDTLHNRINMRV
jgi:hypothetical protein